MDARLGDWIATVIEAKRAHKSPSTAEVYETKLGHFATIWGEGLQLAEITPDLIDAYVRTRREQYAARDRRVSDHTICKELGCLQVLLKYARRKGAYTADIEALRPPDLSPNYTPVETALYAEEVTRLLAELPAPKAALVGVGVALATRLSECMRLRPEHFDLGRWLVKIPGTKTKTSKRMLPILEPFRPIVTWAIQHLPIEWPNNVRRDLHVACRRAGVVTISPNDLRRTCATLLCQAGVDKDTARLLLGHAKNSKILELVYDKPKPEQLRERAERALGANPIKLALPPEHGGPVTVESTVESTPQADAISRNSEPTHASLPPAKAAESYETEGFLNRRSAVRLCPGVLENGLGGEPGASLSSQLSSDHRLDRFDLAAAYFSAQARRSAA